jgi:hypothetical protein
MSSDDWELAADGDISYMQVHAEEESFVNVILDG